MSQFAGCLVLEWGWGFLAWTGIVFFAVVGVLVLIIKLVRKPTQAPSQPASVILEKLGVIITGEQAVFVAVILLAISAIGYVTYKGYESFKDSYSVAVDSPEIGVELQALRDKFQGETQATIIIRDAAKKFSVTGSYEGACVSNLFDSICRKYTSKLSCRTSWFDRTLVVDLTQAK